MFGFKKRKIQQRDAPTTSGVKSTVSLSISDYDDIVYSGGYSSLYNNEEIRKCAHKIADLVSNMTIMLMQNSDYGDVRVKNSLSRKIDVNPNKLMTRKQFIYKIVTDMIDYGNSIVYPYIKDGLIDDLIIFDMQCVSYQQTTDGYKVYYKGRYYEWDEVLHFTIVPDREKPWIGCGFAPQLAATLKNLGQANETKTAYLQSKWKPPLIIAVNSDAEELVNEERKEKVLNSYVGTAKAGQPWVIPADEVKVTTVRPLTLKDLCIYDSIELDKKVIAGVFGIPPSLLGVGTYNVDEYNNFINSVICSYGQIIQQELTKKLLYDPTLYFKFNPRSLLQFNLSEKTAHVTSLRQIGCLNNNEVRNEFDYSPVDKVGMDEYTMLENYIPVDKLGEQNKLGGGNDENGGTEKDR